MAEAASKSIRGSGKEYYERISSLMSTTQVTAAEAAKAVAQEFEKTEGSVLNAYYRYSRKLKGGESGSGTSSASRRRGTKAKTVDGYLADARAAFEGALKRVSADVEDAQAELDRVKTAHAKDLEALKARQAKELEAAKAKLADAKATVKAEKAKLEEKIKLLSA
jgi:hypothetical protein